MLFGLERLATVNVASIKFKRRKVMEEKRVMSMYVIYDSLAEESGPVFEAKNDMVARRSFESIMEQNKVGNVAEYRLFKVGEIEKESMFIKVAKKLIDLEFGKKEEEEL